jgi:hypothetical protein
MVDACWCARPTSSGSTPHTKWEEFFRRTIGCVWLVYNVCNIRTLGVSAAGFLKLSHIDQVEELASLREQFE